jgi:hypothetical protein
MTYPPSPARRGAPPSPGTPRPATRSRLALGMSVAVLGQPLIVLVTVIAGRLGPGSGPYAFWLAELLLLIGCIAGFRRARAHGDRALATGLLTGWAVAAALWLACGAVLILAAVNGQVRVPAGGQVKVPAPGVG